MTISCLIFVWKIIGMRSTYSHVLIIWLSESSKVELGGCSYLGVFCLSITNWTIPFFFCLLSMLFEHLWQQPLLFCCSDLVLHHPSFCIFRRARIYYFEVAKKCLPTALVPLLSARLFALLICTSFNPCIADWAILWLLDVSLQLWNSFICVELFPNWFINLVIQMFVVTKFLLP